MTNKVKYKVYYPSVSRKAGLDNTDCIPYWGVMPCPLSMTLNSILCWGTSSRTIMSVKYYFIAITPRFTNLES